MDELIRPFTAVSDKADSRDVLYVAPNRTVKREISIEMLRGTLSILDQGSDGACTGFGLAATIHRAMTLMWGTFIEVSPWMLYSIAKDHDEFSGREYAGSSCRGALKGWSEHGVLPAEQWQKNYTTKATQETAKLATQIPCGCYSRVNTRGIRDVHAAINSHGAVYCSATVHEGWMNPTNGTIAYSEKNSGGHAFCLVGYTNTGFVVQNSWGEAWGDKGLAVWSYADYTRNIYDAWVIGLGAPIEQEGTPW
jgi:hypothetical protein